MGATAAGPLHPCVLAARELAERLLVPYAEQVDRQGVPTSHIDAIRRAGLLGLNGPVDEGGSAVAPGVFREIVEVLAGADCATWFVQAQHHSPLAMLARSESPARHHLLGPLSRGEMMSGVAFAHLRRFPATPVTATPLAGGGTRFDGVAPWCTGWGLNDVLLIGGITPGGDCLFAFVPAVEQATLRPSEPLRLAALEASSTVRLVLDGLDVGPEGIVCQLPYAEWAAADRATTVNVNPAVFGVTGTALAHLVGHDDPVCREAAAALGAELMERRAECYRLSDEVPAGHALAQRLTAKTEAVDLMVRATTALVAAGGGASLSLDAPAQRLAREALFLVVQAQTVEVRHATLRRLVAGPVAATS